MNPLVRVSSGRPWAARLGHRAVGGRIAPNVWFIGATSFLTDISSEMVVSILPVYLVAGLGLSPLVFGVVDGLYPGVTTLVRWVGGAVADRTRQHKGLALLGYGISAASRLAWLPVAAHLGGIVATVTADRIGKGIRTAPRDALISLSSAPDRLASAFGLHRSMDAGGAIVGPLAAAAILFLAPGRFDLVFVTSFAVAIVGVLVMATWVINPTRDGARAGEGPAEGRPSALPRVRGLWLIVLGGGALALVTISDAFVYLVLQRRGVVAPAALPLLFVGTNATFVLLAVPIGALADRIERWKIFLAGHACLLLLYVVLLNGDFGIAIVPVALLLLGAYYAATDGVLSAMASVVLPAAERGAGLGIVATATSLGRMVASIWFGWIWSVQNDTVALSGFVAVLPLVMVVGAVTLRRAQPHTAAR